ncbi:MAG: c-type cytochrome [Candidatus Eisenbacteria bacterium]|nr:c-type cytochrome [Candidatus Eisenbacteria bacterium]
MTSETSRPTFRTALRHVPLPLAFVLTAMLTVTACRLLDPEPLPAPKPRLVVQDTLSAVSKGARLYAQQCATCHGDSAQGLPARGPAIQGARNIAEIVRHGRGDMPAYTAFADSEISQIELFLARFALPTDGPGLYSYYCARCHGSAAEGGTSGPGLAALAPSAYPSVDIPAWSAVSQGTYTMARLPGVTQEQATLIQAWLAALPAPATGRDLYFRYCMQCHGSTGRGTARCREGVRGKSGEVYEAVRYGKESMPSYPMISSAGISQLQAYIRSMP